MKKPRIAARLFVSGSPTWARTRDLRINSPSLYRLSYRGIGSAHSRDGGLFGQPSAVFFHLQFGDMAEGDAHRCGAAAVVGAAEVQGVGAVALVDLVEHAVEILVLVVGVEQVARGLAVLDEVGEGDADLE
jgi:hypothetical protein